MERLAMGWNAHLTELARWHETGYRKARLTGLIRDGGVYEHEHAFYGHVFQHGNDFARVSTGHYAFDYAPGFWGGCFRYEYLCHVTLPLHQSPAGSHRRVYVENVTCVICGASLTGKRRHSQTCSPKCRKALSRRKK